MKLNKLYTSLSFNKKCIYLIETYISVNTGTYTIDFYESYYNIVLKLRISNYK